MANTELITREIVERLGEHIRQSVPNVAKILVEWPSSSEILEYPSVTILTKEVRYTNAQSYVMHQGVTNPRKKAELKYVVGYYDFSFRVEGWAKNKEDRHELFAALQNAFVPEPRLPGVNLVLEGYHNAIAHYHVEGMRYGDAESASQRTEWRVILDIVSGCRAIVTKEEFVILTTQLQLETNPPGELDSEEDEA